MSIFKQNYKFDEDEERQYKCRSTQDAAASFSPWGINLCGG